MRKRRHRYNSFLRRYKGDILSADERGRYGWTFYKIVGGFGIAFAYDMVTLKNTL